MRFRFLSLILLGVLVLGSATAATLTLQQGSSGFSGCDDTFIGTGGYNDDGVSNFGECDTLMVHAEHYNPG